MPKDFSRMDRIASLIQEVLARIIQVELQDQSLGMVTITVVQMTRDLSLARVYVVTHESNEEKNRETIKLLNQSAKFLRFRLAKEIQLRKMPELHFYYDDVWQQGFRVSQLLGKDLPKKG